MVKRTRAVAVMVGLLDVACGGGTKPALVGHSISGTVTGAGVAGFTVMLAGASTGTTTTDEAGKFSFGGLSDGSYTVTPSLRGYTFTPSSQSVQVAGADQPGKDFAAALAPVSLATFQPASLVIGQPDFVSGLMNRGGAAGAGTLNYVYGTVAIDSGGRLFVADTNNGRVLAYDPFPASNGASASLALVQPGVATGPGSFSPYMPEDVVVAGSKLLVNDGNNARVLIYDPVPSVTGAAPQVVVGWVNGSTPRSGCARDALNHPIGMTVAAGKLIVADGLANRVLIWNGIPSTSGAPADVVLGQKDFTHCAANDESGTGTPGTFPTARTLSLPTGVWSDGTRLLVVDQLNNRVLVWNTFPTVSQTAADLVLGQANFGSATGGTSSTAFWSPASAASNGTQIVVSDVGNHRVLGWSALPTSNGTPADFVLGQSNFGAAAANDDDQNGFPDATPSARTLNFPMGVTFLPGRLVVADSHNFRFLVFQAP